VVGVAGVVDRTPILRPLAPHHIAAGGREGMFASALLFMYSLALCPQQQLLFLVSPYRGLFSYFKVKEKKR
jgi:hypothetical protein